MTNYKDMLINLKGKVYLPVQARVLAFREEIPSGQIITELVHLEPIIFKATILDGDGAILATGYGSAVPKPGAVWAGREIEKAETAAIGRALHHAGFGTQYALDAEDADEESGHLADSPVTPNNGFKSPFSNKAGRKVSEIAWEDMAQVRQAFNDDRSAYEEWLKANIASFGDPKKVTPAVIADKVASR